MTTSKPCMPSSARCIPSRAAPAPSGLDDLVTFAHLFETVLDEMRGGKVGITVDAMHVLLRAGDMLSDLVACARDGVTPDCERMGQLLAELDALVDGAGGGIDDAPFEFVPTIVSVEAIETIDTVEVAPETGLGASNYSIRFAPKGELYGTGNEPLALFRALQQLGDLTVQADVESVPLLSDFDPSEPRLRWTLTLATEATREEIEAVFEFVADVAELGIEALPDPGKTAGWRRHAAGSNTCRRGTSPGQGTAVLR